MTLNLEQIRLDAEQAIAAREARLSLLNTVTLARTLLPTVGQHCLDLLREREEVEQLIGAMREGCSIRIEDIEKQRDEVLARYLDALSQRDASLAEVERLNDRYQKLRELSRKAVTHD